MIHNVQIDDPISPQNNVGKSSFKFEEIKQALRNASFFAFGSCFCSSHNSQLETALQKTKLFKKDSEQFGRFFCDSVLARVIYTHALVGPHLPETNAAPVFQQQNQFAGFPMYPHDQTLQY